jgi:hypothetical protein
MASVPIGSFKPLLIPPIPFNLSHSTCYKCMALNQKLCRREITPFNQPLANGPLKAVSTGFEMFK